MRSARAQWRGALHRGGADCHPWRHDCRGVPPLPHSHFLEGLKEIAPSPGEDGASSRVPGRAWDSDALRATRKGKIAPKRLRHCSSKITSSQNQSRRQKKSPATVPSFPIPFPRKRLRAKVTHNKSANHGCTSRASTPKPTRKQSV